MKFELTSECKIVFGVKLFRIRALEANVSVGVKIGVIGGWVEKKSNLAESGDAWVSRNAEFYSLHGSGNVIQSAPFSKNQKERNQEMIEITVDEAIGLSVIALSTGVGVGAFILCALIRRASKRLEKEMEGGGYGRE